MKLSEIWAARGAQSKYSAVGGAPGKASWTDWEVREDTDKQKWWGENELQSEGKE